jgi:hypothetical protein
MQDGVADWLPWLLLLLGCMWQASECVQFMLQFDGAASNFKIHLNADIIKIVYVLSCFTLDQANFQFIDLKGSFMSIRQSLPSLCRLSF